LMHITIHECKVKLMANVAKSNSEETRT